MQKILKKNPNLVIFVIASLALGFILGFSANWAQIRDLKSKVEAFESREKALQALSAPPGGDENVPEAVINSLSAPN